MVRVVRRYDGQMTDRDSGLLGCLGRFCTGILPKLVLKSISQSLGVGYSAIALASTYAATPRFTQLTRSSGLPWRGPSHR